MYSAKYSARHGLYRYSVDMKYTGKRKYSILLVFTHKHLEIISNYKVCILQPYHNVTSHNKAFSRSAYRPPRPPLRLPIFFYLVTCRYRTYVCIRRLSLRNFFFGSTSRAPNSLSRIIIDVES